jgi:hypothetical protein
MGNAFIQENYKDNNMNQQPDTALNWKDRTVAFILILLGIIFLVLQIISIVSSRADAYSIHEKDIVLSRTDLTNDLRIYVTIAGSLAGGILLLLKKRWGWILSQPIMLLFLGLSVAAVYSACQGGQKMPLALALAGTAIVLLCVLHLFMPATLKKFRTGKPAWLPALVFLAILILLYFVLQ